LKGDYQDRFAMQEGTHLAENGFEMTGGRLSHYMQGRNYPDPPVLTELAKALGVSADWLLGLTEESLPVDDLVEMLGAAQVENYADKISKTLNTLSREEKQQVIQYAEFLLWLRS
jgi:transcriptional regulator with XRE-family HTH domain